MIELGLAGQKEGIMAAEIEVVVPFYQRHDFSLTEVPYELRQLAGDYLVRPSIHPACRVVETDAPFVSGHGQLYLPTTDNSNVIGPERVIKGALRYVSEKEEREQREQGQRGRLQAAYDRRANQRRMADRQAQANRDPDSQSRLSPAEAAKRARRQANLERRRLENRDRANNFGCGTKTGGGRRR